MAKPSENTTSPRPVGLTRGDGTRLQTDPFAEASRRSAENVRARGAVPPRPGAPPQAPPAAAAEAEGPFAEASRRSAESTLARGASSQAGLAAARGPRNAYAGAPKPGSPGARFTPVVRGPSRGVQQQPSPDLITEVPEHLRPKAEKQAESSPQQVVDAAVARTGWDPSKTVPQAHVTRTPQQIVDAAVERYGWDPTGARQGAESKGAPAPDKGAPSSGASDAGRNASNAAFATDVLSRASAVLDEPGPKTKSAPRPRPLSERYDYVATGPVAPTGDEPELGG